jgi:hypothetical protein
MPRKAATTQKKNIVAFKVEDDLAEFLNNLPNKSDFIRKAILAQFGMTCPLCVGSGVVAKGLHDHYKPILAAQTKRPCEKCKTAVEVPTTADGAGADQKRFEQFLRSGALYCARCYANIPKCHDCDWHIPTEKAVEHFKTVHAH